jgi:hypothetical protein
MRVGGYIDAAIYVIMTAISFVYLNKFCQQVDPVIALFAMSFIAIISFNLMSIKHIKATYMACWNNKLLFIIMSGALALDWTCMLFASYIADPFVSMAGLFIFLAIIGFGKLFLENRAISNLLSVMLLIISAVILYSEYQVNSSGHLGLGILLGGVAGTVFYVYIASSSELVIRNNLSTMQVLATRFWVLFIGVTFFVPYQNLFPIIINNIIPLIIISYGSLIIPIYFNQQAIKKLGGALTSVFISFVPPVTYLFYVLYNHNMVWSNVFVCIVISIALVLPYLFKLKRSGI